MSTDHITCDNLPVSHFSVIPTITINENGVSNSYERPTCIIADQNAKWELNGVEVSEEKNAMLEAMYGRL